MLLLWFLVASASAITESPYDEPSSTMPPGVSDGSSCIGVKDPAMTSDALKKLSADFLGSCLALLGKDRINEQQASEIWNRLVEVNGGAPEYVPEYQIRHLGWIAVGIPASHMLNLTMTDVDTVAALGLFRNLTESQLSSLAQAFRDQWPSKEPEDWTDIDMTMLGHILCGFNETDLLRVHADVYKMAALDGKVSSLRGCNNETSQALAKLAISADAFGEPHLWEPPHVRAVGCVLSGLPVELLNLIPPASMTGLSVDSARCLPPRTTSSFTSDQQSNLSPGAAAAIGGPQKDVDVSPPMSYGGHDDDYMAKNNSYSILSIVCGCTAIFWGAMLWVAFEYRP